MILIPYHHVADGFLLFHAIISHAFKHTCQVVSDAFQEICFENPEDWMKNFHFPKKHRFRIKKET